MFYLYSIVIIFENFKHVSHGIIINLMWLIQPAQKILTVNFDQKIASFGTFTIEYVS